MKVEAYIVDCCKELRLEKHTIGIVPTEDLYDIINSYPSIANPAKAIVHHCMQCYRKDVLTPAGLQVDRKKDENAYKLKLRELHYALRKKAVDNYRKRTM